MRRALALLLGSVLLFVAVYAVAFGTSAGRSLDWAAIASGPDPGSERVRRATGHVLRLLDLGSVAAIGVGIVVLALARRRTLEALAAVALVAGANVTTHGLQPFLAHHDALGGEDVRKLHASFPSGHATLALSLGLAVVLVAPPSLRYVAALGSGGYAAAVGVAAVALHTHYPSDVAAGFLVAAGWAALVTALVGARAHAPRIPPERVVLGALLVAAPVVLVLAVPVLRQPDLVLRFERHAEFFGAAAGLFLLSAALSGALAVASTGGGGRAGAVS